MNFTDLSQFAHQAIFVFGSNLQGIHGAGAAAYARKWRGAEPGRGEGLTGQSYALPTKFTVRETVPNPTVLQQSVSIFLRYARSHPEMPFMVSRVGCGLAGFTDAQVYPLFEDAPENCFLPGTWQHALGRASDFPLIIAGSRSIGESEVQKILDEVVDDGFQGKIVSGMARGVDQSGFQWAKKRGLPIVEAPALWDHYGKAAGFIRNQWMSWYSTHLLALWDGESSGTKAMIKTAQTDKLETQVHLMEPVLQPASDFSAVYTTRRLR